jgi:hypothetical protein
VAQSDVDVVVRVQLALLVFPDVAADLGHGDAAVLAREVFAQGRLAGRLRADEHDPLDLPCCAVALLFHMHPVIEKPAG